ncbi:MAG: hypothetical protein Q8K86_04495 [Candidatus Nanopelagicaceae bacterium]|nr:hypothetical protein [Candidatus Nanopelagicaceae bacterium]
MSNRDDKFKLSRGKKIGLRSLAIASIASAALLGSVLPQASAAGGFNQYGYNYSARIFSGPADGVDKVLNGKVWGDPTYANDHLVMKWNAAWDACNANRRLPAYVSDDPAFCAGAWVTNEWNGNAPGGSGWSEHIKIIWVGSAGDMSSYWVDGGYSVWGNYEVISDKAMDPDHIKYVWAAGSPNGLGSSK